MSGTQSTSIGQYYAYIGGMQLDVIDMHAFYTSRLGRSASQALSARIRAMWPDVKGESMLGLGYATPYLGQFAGEADRVIGAMPARQGVIYWPAGERCLTTLVEESDLPFADASVDRVLLVHYLENSEHIRAALREIWRVLAPAGRLLILTPNRNGLWAHRDATPFGHGRPFSRTQLTSLLRDLMFSPEVWSTALHTPPWERSLLIRSTKVWEYFGSTYWPGLAGLHLVEAAKQIYAPIPAERGFRIARPRAASGLTAYTQNFCPER